MPTRPLLPDEYRFLYLDGVQYYIAWEELHPGCSFFLKTTAPAAVVRQALKPAAGYLNMTLRATNRVEFGYYGVRVWRL